jgi:hypothetical protein
LRHAGTGGGGTGSSGKPWAAHDLLTCIMKAWAD